MSRAPVNTNPAKVPYRANRTRPSGALEIAASQDPRSLLAALDGNRQTRRLALKNAKKLIRTVEATLQRTAGRNVGGLES